MPLPTKQEALELLKQHVQDDYQILHATMVANAMEAIGEKYISIEGAILESRLRDTPDLWYLTGLLHDIDYFEHPDLHPQKSLEWFKEWDYPEELIHAVDAHYLSKGPKPENLLAASLIATDELSGFMYAYSLMRPEGFVGMDAKGVKKRLKDLRFAAKVNREDIKFGIEHMAEMLGKTYDDMAAEQYITLIEVFNKMTELEKKI